MTILNSIIATTLNECHRPMAVRQTGGAMHQEFEASRLADLTLLDADPTQSAGALTKKPGFTGAIIEGPQSWSAQRARSQRGPGVVRSLAALGQA